MKHIIAFFGGDSQTGVTMIAQSVGEYLAAKGYRILLIYAGTEPGDGYLPDGISSSLDDVRPFLTESSVELPAVKSCIAPCGKIDILPAVRSYHSAQTYDRDAVKVLCQCLEEHYDYILLDGGSSPSSPLALSVLRYCEELFVVMTQQEKSFQRWIMRKELVRSLAVKPRYIINKYLNERIFYSVKEIASMLECGEADIFKIPYVPYGWQAETERETLLKYRSFAKGIQKISREISGTGNGRTKGSREKHRFLKRRIQIEKERG